MYPSWQGVVRTFGMTIVLVGAAAALAQSCRSPAAPEEEVVAKRDQKDASGRKKRSK